MRFETIQEYWKVCKGVYDKNSRVLHEHMFAPRVICADGFSVSIQAGSALYSTPREDGLAEYDAYELGFPTMKDPLLEEYAEENVKPDGKYIPTVYPYTPVDVINQVLKSHGGIVDIDTRHVYD